MSNKTRVTQSEVVQATTPTTTKEEFTPEEKIVTDPKGDEVGYIRKIHKTNGVTYIDFDAAKIFWGKAAVNAMNADKNCVSPGDCAILDGYWISNESTSTRSIEIAKNAKVIQSSIRTGGLYWITQDKSGQIISIVEQYVP
jgi:hypothetical protein